LVGRLCFHEVVLHCRALPPFASCGCNPSFGVMQVGKVCDQEDPTAYPGQVGIAFFLLWCAWCSSIYLLDNRGINGTWETWPS
jgi:hypothetical protein